MDWNKYLGVILILCCPLFGQETNEELRTTTMILIEDQYLLARSINNFGYKLMMETMKKNENMNIAMSPTSITGVLAMILLGSVGQTYDEIANILGFSKDILANRKNHERFGELLQALNTNSSSKTTYADAIFVDNSTHLRDIYRTYLKTVYHGDAIRTDFGDVVKAREVINEWVKEHTKGKIGFLKQTLPESTRVVLLSAVYFSGQWAKPFLPEYTREMLFKTPNKEVMANLMANFGNFDYLFSVEDQLHMVALPYNDSTTTMYVLKPRFPKRLSLFDLMSKLDYNKIEGLINRMTSKTCVIRFPKMKLQSNVKLEVSLKALGVNSMFVPGEANFALMVDGNSVINKTETELISRINTGDEEEARGLKELVNDLINPGVHVDSLIHEVKMTINEFGTEAVAATSAVTTRSAEMFYADTPFYLFIRNEKTKLVTFSAIIYDPTA
ncbi:LOW QUALITY PROTEIN: serine protease inhibitor 13 [Aphomia sociella]